MFKSIDMFKFLTNTFEREGKAYRFEKFSNLFIILEPWDKSTQCNSNGRKWVRFEDLVHPGAGWKIKMPHHSQNVSDFLKRCLDQALRCLKGNSTLTKDRLNTRLQKAADYKELIAADFEGLVSGKLPRNRLEELLTRVKDDLALLEGLKDHTGFDVINANIDEKEPFADLTINQSSYKTIPEPDEPAKLLEKDYQRSKAVIRKDPTGNVLPFLKLQIENYIKTHFPPSNGGGNTVINSFDLDIKLIESPANSGQQVIIAQLTRQPEPNLILIEQDTAITLFAALNSKDGYILCKLVFSSDYFHEPGLFKIRSKSSGFYLDMVAGIRSVLQGFVERHPISNWEYARGLIWEHDQLIKLLNDLEAYSKKLSEAHVPIPALLFELIGLGWKHESWNELFKASFDRYNKMISQNSGMERITTDFYQIEYGIGKRNIRFHGSKLDELTEALKAIALQTAVKDSQQGKALISTLFNILQQFTSHLSSVKSTFQKVNCLRVEREPVSANEFIAAGFQIFKKDGWHEGKYQFLNEGTKNRVKRLAKAYLGRKINSTDDLRSMEEQYKILRSRELNIRFDEMEMDQIIEPIIVFAGKNKTLDGCIDECRRTIAYLSASEKKDTRYQRLNEIKIPDGLFDDNRHQVVFLNIYLNQNWPPGSHTLLEKDIHGIFFEAVTSLLDEKDGKAGIKLNLEILEDTTSGVQDNFRIQILTVIYKQSSYYKISGHTLALLKQKPIPAFILTVLNGLKDREYPGEGELIKDLDFYIGKKLKELKKVKINDEELIRQKKSIMGYARLFIKNQEKLNRYLDILTAVYDHQKEKISTFETFSRIRMSHANVLDEQFLQTAFNIFSAAQWEDNKIPAILAKQIKKVFAGTFNDANISNRDVEANVRLLTQELGIRLAEDEKKTLDENWREKIKIMIDRTYEEKK